MGCEVFGGWERVWVAVETQIEKDMHISLTVV